MPKVHDHLFGQIANFQSLRTAALRAAAGKRFKPGVAAFMAGLERECLRLERELLEGRYRPGSYVKIEIHDPKHRVVSAAPFRDRVVHHTLCAVAAPIFDRSMIHHSYANREGKGTHRAIAAFERYRNRHGFVLRGDIFRYFPSIDHTILKSGYRRRIGCPETLSLMDSIVDGSNRQETVNLHFPGDELFSPFERRRGLPIGNLTSQMFANLYLDPFDHFVTERLGAPYVRYMDDIALFADTPKKLEEWNFRIADFLVGRRLRLHPEKTGIASTG
jgi:retron-type reverse transcriptase